MNNNHSTGVAEHAQAQQCTYPRQYDCEWKNEKKKWGQATAWGQCLMFLSATGAHAPSTSYNEFVSYLTLELFKVWRQSLSQDTFTILRRPQLSKLSKLGHFLKTKNARVSWNMVYSVSFYVCDWSYIHVVMCLSSRQILAIPLLSLP